MAKIVLTTPEPALSEWQPKELRLIYDHAEQNYAVLIQLRANTGEVSRFERRGDVARSLIEWLNAADNSVLHLWPRLLQWLVDQEEIDGTVQE